MKNIKLKKEQKDEIIRSIKNYYDKERGEDLGDLGAQLIMDFILGEIGPIIYNQAISDTYMFMNEKLQDIFILEKHPRS